MATIESLLNTAGLPDSPTPRLDAELLLAQALGKSRSYLRTWPEREVEPAQQAQFTADLARRRSGEPVAYILGQQGFWSIIWIKVTCVSNRAVPWWRARMGWTIFA